MVEPRFTIRQLLAVAGIFSAISGAGGAITVTTQNALQDERIEQHERQISDLAANVMLAATAVAETRTTVKGLEASVLEIRVDTKEIQRLLNRLIGGRMPISKLVDEEP